MVTISGTFVSHCKGTMEHFCWLLLIGVFLGFFLDCLADTQPQLYVEDNNLHIQLADDKLLHFKATRIKFNDVDAVGTLLEAQQSINLLQTYKIYISQINTKMSALENRLLTGGLINGSYVSYNTTVDRATTVKIRSINRKLSAMDRRIKTIEQLLTKDECASNPCNHGAVCLDMYNGFICQCPNGWEGTTCDIDINECVRFIGTDLGCQNGGTCQNLPGSYQCQCTNGWTGIHCNRKPADCSSGGSEICGHGTCIPQNNQDGFKCLCDAGWTNDSPSKPCTTDVDECAQKHPSCSTNPLVQCINTPGSYMCQHCPPGYTGNGYYCADINECELFNGGCSVAPYVECINIPGSKKCGPCPAGYVGDGKTCTYQGICHVNNGGCSHLATCVNNPAIGETYVQCVCVQGYTGSGIGPTGCIKDSSAVAGACTFNPCVHGICVSNNSTQGFACICNGQYSGRLCDRKIDPCNPNPCLNGGTCIAQRRRFVCNCMTSFSGRICQTQKQACMEHITQTNGTVKYPPDDYDVVIAADLNCAWRISTDDDKVLEISFTKFIFMDSAPCSAQFLEVHDGPNLLAPVYGRFCGTALPSNGTLTTTHNSIYLWVRSTIHKLPTLELAWISKAPECGGTLASGSGLISSPGYPHGYPNNRDCYWTFAVPVTKRLLFHIYTLNIGNNTDCSKDYVEFVTQTSTRQAFAKYCNSTLPDPFYSLSSSGSIHFRSDGQDSYSGFQIGYSVVDSIPGCGGVYTTSTGYLHSIKLTESMPRLLICTYQIKLLTNTSVKLEFTEINLEDNCDVTNVAIYVETSSTPSLLIRRCGSTLDGPLITRGSNIIVKSLARYNLKNQWTLKYEALCEQIYTDSSNTFTSLTTAGNYCRHLIMQPPGWVISLDLEVLSLGHLPLGSEIKIYDGDSESGTLLGTYHKNEKAKVVSSSNYLLITVTYNNLLFKPTSQELISATYRSFDLGCGGLLNNDLGTIFYPPNREKYNGNKDCTWVIRAPPEKVVQLTWMMFNLEKSADCAYDNVKIFDNNTDTGKGYLVGKYCGHQTPPVVLSTSNVVTVAFKSDNTIHGDGFIVSYSFIKSTSVCGGSYFTPAGILKSPEYPNQYPTNRECVWVITVPPGDQIMLTVKNFTLEAYPNCKYDWLEIRNGGYSSSPLIGTYCGTTIPKTIPSHANKLYLKFNSDMSRTASGFMIEWSSATTGCGGSLIGPTGSITSPQYPEPYSKNAECIWNIAVNVGSKIRIIFSDVDLESHTTCAMDYIQLFDGPTTSSKSLGTYCTPQINFITSTSNEMTVLFRSDVSFQGRGFQLKYFIFCNNTLSGFGGVIESPNFPNEYPKDQNCNWDIVVPTGNKINISFSDFSVEESFAAERKHCDYDFVEILYTERNSFEYYDESDSTNWISYKRYCGQQNPGLIALNTNHAKIHFVSDSLLIGSGFRLEWQLNGCGGILSRSYGSISSPNYPNTYPGQLECKWTMKLPYGEKIELYFTDISIERDSECSFDYIEVFNGPDETYPLIGKFCQQSTTHPIKLTSSGNNMFVHFLTDNSYEGRGFSAHYNSITGGCGGEYTLSKGYIYSPNYPKNFDKKQTCEYLITTSEHHIIDLKFEDVDLPINSNCNTNYIKIYDGPTQAYPLLKTVCGNTTNTNETIQSSTDNMLVEFSSNTYLTSKGFKAFYQKACGGKVKTSGSGDIEIEKELVSVNNIYENEINGNCSVTIIADDPTKHITLTIQKIDISLVWCDDESQSYVRIYNGPFRTSPLLKQYCTSAVPPAIVSDGSALHIEVSSLIGFKATYSVIDSECGGELMTVAGSISSPGWPKRYPLNTDCTWTISVGAGNIIKLSFKNLDIPESPSCNLDFLEVREGDNENGKLCGVFCGTKIPTTLTAIGKMQLIFRSTTIEGNSQNKGFLVDYVTSRENRLYGSEGVIENPYDESSGMYSWLINTNISTIIELSFTFLEFSNYGDGCNGNSLGIYDGMDNQAPLLKQVCSRTEAIFSTSNMMFLQFERYSYRVDIKFRARWKELPKRSVKPAVNDTTIECQSLYKLENKENLMISSPGYPNGYAPYLKCEWIVEASEQYHLTLKFVKINFGAIFYRICTYIDSVSVFTKRVKDDQWTLLKEICVGNFPIPELEGFNMMKVTFKSNGYLNGTGFLARIKTVCGGTLTNSFGSIKFDRDDDRDECQWNITVNAGRTIKLTFASFNLGSNEGNACSNYLIIRNGKFHDSPFLGNGKFCGSVPPPSMESISNHLYLKYSGSKNVDGFSLKYEEVSLNCNRNIQLNSDESYTEITSPNYPNVPRAHIECIWIIKAPRGESLRIDFEERFDIAEINNMCDTDYVELRDGGTNLAELIGIECQEMPSTKYTKGNILRIKYHTDSEEPRNGFKANVSINACGGTFREMIGTLDTTLYHIKLGTSCTWWLRSTWGSSINLNFKKFNLAEKDANCTAKNITKVNIYAVDEITGHSTEQYVLCNDLFNDTLTLGSPTVKVVFEPKSNEDQFKLTFSGSAEECGGTLEEMSGIVQTPGYPNSRSRAINCYWKVRVPKGRRITFVVEDVDMSTSAALLVIYDGVRHRPSIVDQTNIQAGKSYDSSDNAADIFYYQNFATTKRGIKITYSSEKETICKGNLMNSNSGEIHGPEVSNSYSCEYKHKKETNTETLALKIMISVHANKSSGIFCDRTNSKLSIQTYEYDQIELCHDTKHLYKTIKSTWEDTVVWASSESSGALNYTILYNVYPCGGILNAESGEIVSPNFPNPPNASIECAWIVKLPLNRIKVIVSTFDLEDCARNYIEIFNGPTSASPKIGKYCKDRGLTTFNSQANEMLIQYKYERDSNDKAMGFRLFYESETEGCGGIYHSDVGAHSPNFVNGNYGNNQECVWDLIAEEGYAVALKFIGRFFIEDSENCTNDFVEVFDRKDDKWVSFGRKCGRSTPSPITSTSNQLRILFRSNSNITARGFQLDWTFVCGATLYATDTPKSLIGLAGFERLYRYIYTPNCTYTIVSKNPKGVLRFKVDYFYTEEGETADCTTNLTVRSIKSPFGKQIFCIDQNLPEEQRYKQAIIVNFANYDSAMYKAHYKFTYQDEFCGGNITTPSKLVYFAPTIPRGQVRWAQPRISCTWNIIAPKDQITVLIVHNLTMLGSQCLIQYLEIFDGLEQDVYKRILKLCGKITESTPILSSSNSMLVFLESGAESFESLEAEVYFTYGPAAGCGGTINLTDILQIRAPNNLLHMDCQWIIFAPEDYKVELEFTEIAISASCQNLVRNHTHYCTCSYIQIRDGGSPFAEQIAKLCSTDNKLKRTFTTSYSTAYIRLYSAVPQNDMFKLTLKPVESICGPAQLTATKEIKELTSPNYPNTYPENLNCYWVIKNTNKFRKIMLYFEKFDLQGDSSQGICDSDRLEIKEEPNSAIINYGFGPSAKHVFGSYFNKRDPFVFCGNDTVPFDYYSVGSEIILTFKSYQSLWKKGVGFKIKYGTSGCNRTIRADEGRIQSEHTDVDEAFCSTTIIASPNTTLSIYFIYFLLIANDQNCTESGLEIRENSLTGPQIFKACGYRVPSPIFSNSSKLVVNTYDSSTRAKFFRYNFIFMSSAKGIGCGGKLFNYVGTFSSPLYPKPYREEIECTWEVTVPKGYIIAFTFKDFNLGGGCTQNKVVIVTYTNSISKTRLYCPGDNFISVIYSERQLEITYYSSVNNGGTGWLAQFQAVKDQSQLRTWYG